MQSLLQYDDSDPTEADPTEADPTEADPTEADPTEAETIDLPVGTPLDCPAWFHTRGGPGRADRVVCPLPKADEPLGEGDGGVDTGRGGGRVPGPAECGIEDADRAT